MGAANQARFAESRRCWLALPKKWSRDQPDWQFLAGARWVAGGGGAVVSSAKERGCFGTVFQVGKPRSEVLRSPHRRLKSAIARKTFFDFRDCSQDAPCQRVL